MLDVSYVRSHFPALESPWALFDNAGGTVLPQQVIDRVTDYMRRYQVQLGASYALSREADERVEEGHRAAEILMGADPGEVVVGPSTTANVNLLAGALRPLLREGDEVVVTNLDHEANIGAWRRLEASGVVLKEWRLNPQTVDLHLDDLEPLLGPRTRLVCFTHCSNVVGNLVDVAAITRRIQEMGAWVCVDGVGFAPHRRVDVKALGVDFYVLSLYKMFGPHQGLLYGRRELLEQLGNPNHFFIASDDVPYKFEPGGVNHELTASLPAILDYFEDLDRHHDPEECEQPGRLDRVFRRIAEWEAELSRPLLEFLGGRSGVRVLGCPHADVELRAPIMTFVVEGRKASEIPPRLDERHVAIRWGHFYAKRAIRDLGLEAGDGAVRVSLAHYNSPQEIERLIEGLDQVL